MNPKLTPHAVNSFLLPPTERKTSSTFWRPAEINLSASPWESESDQFPIKVTFIILKSVTLLVLVHTVFSFFLMLFFSDTDTLVGLPRPIHESVKTLKQVSMDTFLFFNILVFFYTPGRVKKHI